MALANLLHIIVHRVLDIITGRLTTEVRDALFITASALISISFIIGQLFTTVDSHVGHKCVQVLPLLIKIIYTEYKKAGNLKALTSDAIIPLSLFGAVFAAYFGNLVGFQTWLFIVASLAGTGFAGWKWFEKWQKEEAERLGKTFVIFLLPYGIYLLLTLIDSFFSE
mmetsp:Transcript_406/g.532  ORF Transcript_406/g.532 Transcript_406/m.532 type:complete len:167 (+) Transcript_406:24-524(+)